MNVDIRGLNQVMVQISGLKILFSYESPVIIWDFTDNVIYVTLNSSQTTAKHIGQYSTNGVVIKQTQEWMKEFVRNL